MSWFRIREKRKGLYNLELGFAQKAYDTLANTSMLAQ